VGGFRAQHSTSSGRESWIGRIGEGEPGAQESTVMPYGVGEMFCCAHVSGWSELGAQEMRFA